MRLATLFFIFLTSLAAPESAATKHITVFTIDGTATAPPLETGYLQMGSPDAAKSPSGHILSVNSRYLTLDGKPWLPIMGEFHYSRYPERYWEEEILKMKAGGVQIISTYIFWIHHEEVEGQFDWSGQRDLHKFVELCAAHGMYVFPRIGPWAHGEVRNGGFPDWLLKKGPTRVNDPIYLAYVHGFYKEVGQQLKGLLWKDGGPIIGVQLENEYANRAPNGGAAHIEQLESLAIDAGIDVPLYTVTGWDNATYPPHEVIPVFGGYPDEPWAGSLQELSPDTQGVYRFHISPPTGNTGILQGISEANEQAQLWHYPRLTVELGGGMEVTYHRRVVVNENDIAPMALTALGSGINMLGYYMFQGGENPRGKLSTLQESQVTNYPNDVPVQSYDFQAPLGAFGQMSGSFRKLKMINQFVDDFGSDLAPMTAKLPDIVPSDLRDTTTSRLAARTEGNRGFLFFNNYQRNYPLPEHRGIQVSLKLPGETITLPREPFEILSQTSFIWPVNLNLDGVLLKYATAQLFTKVDEKNIRYYFFSASDGIKPEFAFAASAISSLHSIRGKILRENERIYVLALKTSTDVAIEIQTNAGITIRIVLLPPVQAQEAWKVSIDGREHLLITSADVFSDHDTIHLRSRDVNAFSLSVVPEIEQLTANVPLQTAGKDGAFMRYAASIKPDQIEISVEKLRDAASVSPVKMGTEFDWRHGAVAQAPNDAAFDQAGVWRLTFSHDTWKNFEDVFLRINYIGDVGRLYAGKTLLDDNFYNGAPWEIGLKRFSPDTLAGRLELQILPLRKDAPIYVPKTSWPDFGDKPEIAIVKSVTASPEYEVVLSVHIASESSQKPLSDDANKQK